MPERPEHLIEEYLEQAASERGAALRALVNLVCLEYARSLGVTSPFGDDGCCGATTPEAIRESIAATDPQDWAWALSGSAPIADGRQGSVGTPPQIARFMCEMALQEYHEGVKRASSSGSCEGCGLPAAPSVIDPAVGGGVFVLAMASALLKESRRAGRRRMSRTEALRCVRGVDVDRLCVHTAIAASWLWSLGDRAAPEPRAGVFCGDSLLETDEWWRAGPGAQGSFDILVANPPYVRQELVSVGRKEALSRAYPGFGGRSDIYARFFVLAGRLLKPGGVAVVITPSSWMDVDYGRKVKAYLLDNFEIRTIVASSEARLFSRASINAQITVVRKRDGRKPGAGREAVRFLTIGSGWSPRDPATTRVAEVEQVDLRPDRKWGILLRAPSVYFDLAGKTLDGRHHAFCRLGEIATVSFGTKTGANEFFYLRDVSESPGGRELLRSMGNPPGVLAMQQSRAGERAELIPIESRFLTPLVKSLREVPGYAVNPSNLSLRAFNVREAEPGGLAGEYIRTGQAAGYSLRPTCMGRTPWHRLPAPSASVLYSMSWGSRMGAVVHSRECLYDARFYGIEPVEGIDTLLLAAILNTTCTWLFTELSGRPMTGSLPLLDIKIYEVEQLPVLDVRSLDSPSREELRGCMAAILGRDLLDISHEVTMADRRRLDVAVLKMAGFRESVAERLAGEVAGGVSRLVTQRISKPGLVLC